MRTLSFLFALLLAALPAAARSAASSLTLELPPDTSIEAESPDGAPFAFEAAAVNPAGKRISLTCEPASGSVFPLGPTTVSCRGADDDGEEVQGTFVVTVVDTTGPAVGAMSSLEREADGPGGAAVSFVPPTAVDAVDGPRPVACAPASGSTFPLGTTQTTCSAADTRGNVSSVSFAVTVRDTTPPILVPPSDLAVTATSDAGVSATASAVAAFLGGARTSDLVTARPQVAHDAPAFLPVGTTVVTFTATDEAGNTTVASARLTVRPRPASSPPPPGTPPLPSPPAPPAPPAPPGDLTPPGNVRALKATPGDRTVILTWRRPADADFDQVVVFRHAAAAEAARAQIVYRGAAERFVDRRLANGTAYRYVVVSFDRARNASRGVALTVTPALPLLLAPREGARVLRPPVLTWRAVPRATYYNVQLFRGNRKVLTVWPARARVALPVRWRLAGKPQRLSPGTYRWYVWPGFGTRAQNRYGDVLGQSTFTVVRSGR